MKIEIVDSPLELTLNGVAKIHDPAKSYGEELIELLDIVWASVKSRNIPTTGINHAVYGDKNEIFAGVVIAEYGKLPDMLSTRHFVLKRYAYYQYVGPYTRLPQVNKEMQEEIDRQGLIRKAPMIEIYGHAAEDPSKSVTELLFTLE